MIGAYRRIIPRYHNLRLRKLADSHIYHSPNFMLLPYPGRKVVTFHDLSILKYPQYHPHDRLRKLTPEIEKAARNADHIITDSEAVRQEVLEHFSLPRERVTAIHLASSLNSEDSAGDERKAWLSARNLKEKSYFLFVSTLEPRKNISALLSAYESLPTMIKKHHPLVLAGQLGWNSEQFEEKLTGMSTNNQIYRPGYLSNKDLCHLYAGASALVFPSHYEGFGLPIVEAQSFGTPVITANVSCMPEVAGNSALLIDPGDTSSLSLAMQRIVEDQQLAVNLSKAAIHNASRYSWDTTARKTLEVYQRVLEQVR
jgi:alpha-1,3-rhamnosyl/mannosyltransferase